MEESSRFTFQSIGRMFIGGVLVLGGGILTPLPIPVGLLLLTLGLALLARDSRWLRRRLQSLRRSYPAFSGRLRHCERLCPGWLARLLRITEPDRRTDDAKEIRDP